MTARPLRVAVIGTGHLGTYHARIYHGMPDCRLVALVDPAEERAGKLARELDCEHMTSALDLPPELDAVSIAVPTALHAAVAVPLLERGLACLIEKPLASSVAEADQILAAAERGKATVSVGHVERFQPGLRKVRELGLEPKFIECHRLAPFSFRSTDIGVVHDLMIHDLDLVLEMVPSEVVSFDAAGGAILTENEDVASVRLVFANGARANVTASRTSLSTMRRFRMFSAESYVSLDFQANYGLLVRKGPGWAAGRAELASLDAAALAKRPDLVEKGLFEIVELELESEQRPLQAELASFLAAVRAGVAPEVTGTDGRRALELAERITQAIRAQSW